MQHPADVGKPSTAIMSLWFRCWLQRWLRGNSDHRHFRAPRTGVGISGPRAVFKRSFSVIGTGGRAAARQPDGGAPMAPEQRRTDAAVSILHVRLPGGRTVPGDFVALW